MRENKLISDVYWQGASKQKGIKQVGHKTGATCTKKKMHEM
jgi:hypothetical protein